MSRHPSAFVCLFASPDAASAEAQRITKQLAGMLCETGMSVERAELIRDILIDHSHGFAISVAAAHGSQNAMPQCSYGTAVAQLIEALVAERG